LTRRSVTEARDAANLRRVFVMNGGPAARPRAHKERAMLETQAQKKTERRETGRQLTISTAEVLRDYSLAVQSRQASLIGRREVLSGKAKFELKQDKHIQR